MKFTIKAQAEEEPVVQLELRENTNGTTTLIGYRGGRCKALMKFENGKFIRVEDAELPGIRTDGKGRILEKA